ncbi:MAG: PilZ domain-containing protein [Deltaproteobacteria bacterium]
MEDTEKQFTRASRHVLQILARLTIDRGNNNEESFFCNTVNISLSGAFVETGAAIPIGSLLKYAFCIPGIKTPLNITGEIVRSEGSPAMAQHGHSSGMQSAQRRLNRYGIMFLDMKEEDRRVMEGYLLSKDGFRTKQGNPQGDKKRPS